MVAAGTLGRIVVLNGAPRSGKSSIAAVIQERFPGVWMNLGVDRFKPMVPDRFQPGIGLRPGGERPDLEPLVALLYHALYGSIALHSRLGLNVVADVGHHDWYSMPREILSTCARELQGLPAWFIGVRCPLDVILLRRRDTWSETLPADGTVPPPVRRWQDAVHVPGIYDLEVDTSVLGPQECAEEIYRRLQSGAPPTAFPRLAAMGSR